MKETIYQSVLQLYRRRRDLLAKKRNDPDFAESYAVAELFWNNVVIDKYLEGGDISELTDHLDALNKDLKK